MLTKEQQLEMSAIITQERLAMLRSSVLSIIKNRHDLYLAHDLFRKNLLKDMGYSYEAGTNIEFHKPFLSPIQLWIESNAAHFVGNWVFEFTSLLWHLESDKIICRVTQPTHSLDSPNDFREADLGDVFLNVPLLVRVYKKSVAQHKAQEAKTRGKK